MSIVKKFIVFVVVVMAATEVWGQAARSPFTTYGVGEAYGNGLVHNQGMGGIGVSQPQMWYLNNQNPALLVYNTLTVFEVGVVAESRTLKGDSLSSKTKGGNMNYLAVAFPIKLTKWTTSLGLMPYTNVDYDFVYSELSDDGVTPIVVNEKGTGGLTQLYWSNGVRLTKEISIGAKAAYIFGPIDDTYSSTLQKTNQVPYTITVEDKTSMKGFNLGLGFSFSKDSIWDNKYRVSVGGVYTLGSDLTGRRSHSFFRLNASGDTLDNSVLAKSKGKIKIPSNFTLGASLNRGSRWSIGTEFMIQNWDDFSSMDQNSDNMEMAWRAALGGEFTPDAFSADNYLKRITYRVGASFEEHPWLVNDNKVKDLGINFGFSLPTGRSSLDLAFRYGKRGNKSDNLLEETYFKVFFGITFNDQWFVKRRFD
jgi:hypothetical protein